MADPFDLARFVTAQDRVIDAVRQELAAGRKRTHWMWFVFPQLRSLGRSPTALHYGIGSRAEALAYLAHPVLGPRLALCTALVTAVEGRSLHEIFGSPDDMKFHSCVTLFAEVAPEAEPFQLALAKFFAGAKDGATVRILARA